MQETYWVLIDTETTGIKAPIHVVDLGAQLMRGWEPEGTSFQRLINTAGYISPEASRIHGYTKEILERDGFPPQDVYGEFSKYCENFPIVSYNLEFDYDRVLLPEWERLNIAPIGNRGFCALRLAQRLLDPVPAGNCKLQTLRQFYRLPERGAHSAMGDVLTVVDLLRKVLHPIARHQGLKTWKQIVSYSQSEWYPSRLPFGKFKGRIFQDARNDRDLFSWLEWLANSETARSRKMGGWYLTQLKNPPNGTAPSSKIYATAIDTDIKPIDSKETRSGIVVFENTDLKRLKALVSAARERLADLETIFTRESNAVAVTQAALFSLLKDLFQERDRLKLLIEYRQKFLDKLFHEGDDEAEEISLEYDEAKMQSDDEFFQAEREAENTRILSEEQQNEIKEIHRKLVRLFHPDRHVGDPEKQKAYTRIMSEINHARDAGNIEILREISNDPEGYMAKHKLGKIDLSDEEDVINLGKLYEALQAKIVEIIEEIDNFRSDPKYELYKLSTRRPDYLKEVADSQKEKLSVECERLKVKADALADEIEGLTGRQAI
ncbi:MAG: exonuclease [Rhodospirillales bacterium]|jgi:DNA polymerase III epsilon subunit-like protein|nr:exonuclease [Rhodospirillales bacterium]